MIIMPLRRLYTMHLGVVEIDCAGLPRGAESIDQSLSRGPVVARILVGDGRLRTIRPGGPYIDIQPVTMLLMAFEPSSARKTDIADAKRSKLLSHGQPVRHGRYRLRRARVAPLAIGPRPGLAGLVRAVSIVS